MPAEELGAAAQAVVEHLATAVPLCAWLVALVDDSGGWTPVATTDSGYGFAVGTRLEWQDTICSRMVQGLGPHVMAKVEAQTAYGDAPIALAHPIKAYVGTALLHSDGRLIGTLCGMDPEAQPDSLAEHLPLVLLLADLLSRLHQAQHASQAARQRAAVAEAAALHDPLTGALSRLGWVEQVASVARTADRSGAPLALLSIDLDGLKALNDTAGHLAGDEQLRRLVAALRPALRPADLLARTGGDEFAVAAALGQAEALVGLVTRVQAALEGAGVPASVGAAVRRPGASLETAWALADARMYAEKQVRRGAAAQRGGTRST